MSADWYVRRQQNAENGVPHCLCHGILDYVYGHWFRCRDCNRWWGWKLGNL